MDHVLSTVGTKSEGDGKMHFEIMLTAYETHIHTPTHPPLKGKTASSGKQYGTGTWGRGHLFA